MSVQRVYPKAHLTKAGASSLLHDQTGRKPIPKEPYFAKLHLAPSFLGILLNSNIAFILILAEVK